MKIKKSINFQQIEKKWQKKWEEKKAFQAKEDKKKNKSYILEMFPYPSGPGLHMGHAFNYTIGDIYARFKRMQGFNVLYPMGYDSFGLPAENAAIKEKIHPKKYTEKAIKNFITQQKSLGLSYDWSRSVMTHSPEYYKWNQYFFLQFYKKDLVYRKKSAVNWCSKCNTVLANEQVHDGKCWRHSETQVEIKNLEQWFIKTTKYAEELLNELEKLDWPERIKIMQRNWIGKSEGSEVLFEINGEKWPVFTTRPDTLFGVTFLVVSAQHPRLFELIKKEQKSQVEKFLKKISSTKQEEIDKLEKDGVFTGSYAIHPLTNEKIPIWAGNFVVADYGSGMVMAVPAHDQRDFEFAMKYNLPIKPVVGSEEEKNEMQDLLDAEFKKFAEKANQEKKEFFVTGGFGLRILAGVRYRNNKDIDIAIPKKDFEFWKNYFINNEYENYHEPNDTKRDYSNYALYIKNINGKEIEFDLWVVNVDKDGYYFDTEWKKQRKWNIKPQDIISCRYRNTMVKVVSKTARFIDNKETRNENKLDLDSCFSLEKAYTGPGKLINSEAFNDLFSEEAKEHITKALEFKKLGRKKIQYKLRDWLVSRQRYWGTSIPIIYCEDCGIVPVPEKDLPVLLPEKVKFGKGNPLETNKDFVEVKCPQCEKKGRRETDTMDTFFDSSWYYLRFTDANNSKKPFEKEKANYWMPINQYIGGAEHAVMHLIYARFFSKALRDLGFVNYSEPFPKLFNQGMLHGEDGFVMSKSRGNVVDPIHTISKYSADSLRFFLISMGSPDKDSVWSSSGIEGGYKFLKKVFESITKIKIGKTSSKFSHKLNKTIKSVTEEIEGLKYNNAAIKLRLLFDSLENEISKKDLDSIIKLLSPICPHIAEELWEKLGNKSLVSMEFWPRADETKINNEFDKIEKTNEQAIADIQNIIKIIREKQNKEVEKIYIYAIPNELNYYSEEEISQRINKKVKIFAVNDKVKYDPENKAQKARPGKPAIYVE